MLLGQLPPEVNHRLAGRFLAIAENPILTEHDHAELASQAPLSRGRLDMGAKQMPELALLCAAMAVSLAGKPNAESEILPAPAMNRLVINAVRLLRNPDRQSAKHGAIALALTSKGQPDLVRYSAALIVHPSEEVRGVAASLAILDQATQHILADDPSPHVRIKLACRAQELDQEIIALLRADNHADVVHALAATRESAPR